MELGVVLVVLLVLWLVSGGLGSYLAGQKHRSQAEGRWLGFLFGPFGCLIEALLPTFDAPRATDRDYVIGPVLAQRSIWDVSYEDMEGVERAQAAADREAIRKRDEEKSALAYLADAEPSPSDAIEWARRWTRGRGVDRGGRRDDALDHHPRTDRRRPS